MLFRVLAFLAINILCSFLCSSYVSGLTSITDLEEGLTNQVTQISYGQCKDECKSSLRCISLKYFRRFKLCKLYETEIPLTPRSPDFNIYTKPTELQNEHMSRYAECGVEGIDVTWSCQPRSCSKQMIHEIHGAEMSGNSLEIDSMVKYQCTNVEYSETSTCRPDGTWSRLELACKCRESSTFEFELISSNSTHITAKRICPDGTTLVETVSPSCELATGTWRDTNLVCCESTDSDWLKVFRISDGGTFAILGAWKGTMNSTLDRPLVMRSPKIDDWDVLGITKVKAEAYKDGITVASMVFNACNSNTNTWFAQERLIDSSWDSLRMNSSVDVFSITGRTTTRFFISQFQSSTDEFCNLDVSWFAVSHKLKQCPDPSSVGILYAPGPNPAYYKDMELADDFVVWLKF